jgi:hypothetical protein
MKHKKNYFDRRNDDEEDQVNMRKQEHKRRPIRNWTKTYIEHADEADDLDEFHGR